MTNLTKQEFIKVQRQNIKNFQKELEELINKHSMEQIGGNTPDFILAEMIVGFIKTIGTPILKRDNWYA